MTVIAMTREMGTLGKDVARIVAQRLGLTIVHHELVSTRQAARQAGPSDVARFLEASEEEAEQWRQGISHDGFLTPSEVLALAHRGEVLIRGWGATRLLQGLPGVLSVRICAPMERRIAEMQRRLGVPKRMARREIERNDAAHARSFLSFFAEDWRKPSHYDMVLNTAHLGVRNCAEILIAAARGSTLARDEMARGALADRLLEARIAETLHDGAPLSERAAHVEGTVQGGTVRLYGAVTDVAAAHEIEERIRALPGVLDIRNEISRIRGRYAEG